MQLNVINLTAKYLIVLCLMSCVQFSCSQTKEKQKINNKVITGAENTTEYFHLLKDKKIAIVANQSSIIGHQHLVDSLLARDIQIEKIFSPEHGFRGKISAGVKIEGGKDKKSGLPIISLYGKNKKPRKQDLEDIDLVLFDLQDVGVRFYTYLSTLHYVMEACAESNIPLIVLDRPNPNGYFIDGPVLQKGYNSFVGMHPVPVVYGMTIGEYAQMINGEGWLKNNLKCNLNIIPMLNWTHDNTSYVLPVKPSPNLPNMTAVNLYPSLCFFEGTVISIGRGTEFPFQVYGHPNFNNMNFSFIPKSIPNAAINPKLLGQKCYGFDLRNERDNILKKKQLNLTYLHNAYKLYQGKDVFFNNFFNKLSGNNSLQKQIVNDDNEETIRNSWEKDLANFKKIRKKYLIYK